MGGDFFKNPLWACSCMFRISFSNFAGVNSILTCTMPKPKSFRLWLDAIGETKRIPYLYNMVKWTKQELKLLKNYDTISNDYAATPDIVKDTDFVKKILVLEAKLLIINKPVIGYLGNEAIGIYSFNEALRKEQYYINQGKIFTFHPVNFFDMQQYILQKKNPY